MSLKRKIYVCPNCKENHKIAKTQVKGMMLIQCNCGCNSIISIKNGYYIPNKLEKVINRPIRPEEIWDSYIKHHIEDI